MSPDQDSYRKWSWTLHTACFVSLLAGVALVYGVVVAPLEAQIDQLQQRGRKLRLLRRRAPAIRREHALLVNTTPLPAPPKPAPAKNMMGPPFIGPNGAPIRLSETETIEQIINAAQSESVVVRQYRRGQAVGGPRGQVAAGDKVGRDALLEIHLDCEGAWSVLCRFLQRLHQMPQIIDVRRFQLSARDKSEIYGLQIVLLVHFLPQTSET